MSKIAVGGPCREAPDSHTQAVVLFYRLRRRSHAAWPDRYRSHCQASQKYSLGRPRDRGAERQSDREPKPMSLPGIGGVEKRDDLPYQSTVRSQEPVVGTWPHQDRQIRLRRSQQVEPCLSFLAPFTRIGHVCSAERPNSTQQRYSSSRAPEKQLPGPVLKVA